MLNPIIMAHSQTQSASYDEQIGVSFTQSFTSLAFNVTAIAQSSSSGIGPAYLLNGLSNTGYWYQVGVSYDWGGPTIGFGMNYEVFNPSGTSIFPANGGGGLTSFSGSVNSGNLVLLSLYFNNSTGMVRMYAYDWNTGASASETFSSEGATYFQGQSPTQSYNPLGFTGLMTEWYHVNPYYGSEQQVTYSEQGFQFASAWLWMLERNVNTGQSVFYYETQGPVGLSSQPYSYTLDGAYGSISSNTFITGTLPPVINSGSGSNSGQNSNSGSGSFNFGLTFSDIVDLLIGAISIMLLIGLIGLIKRKNNQNQDKKQEPEIPENRPQPPGIAIAKRGSYVEQLFCGMPKVDT